MSAWPLRSREDVCAKCPLSTIIECAVAKTLADGRFVLTSRPVFLDFEEAGDLRMHGLHPFIVPDYLMPVNCPIMMDCDHICKPVSNSPSNSPSRKPSPVSERAVLHIDKCRAKLESFASESSLVAKRADGINLRGTTGRKIASEHSCDNQRTGYNGKNRKIDALHAVQHPSENVGLQGCAPKLSEHQSAADQCKTLQQNHADDLPTIGAHGNAQTDFPGALCHLERHDSINTNCRQHECEETERSVQHHRKTVPRGSITHHIVHRLDVSQR